MPEAPEVKIIVDGLQQIVGKQITNIAAIGTGKFSSENFNELTRYIFNKKHVVIKSINCKGKFIWWSLEDQLSWWFIGNGLGMTGGWSFNKTNHSQINLRLDNNQDLYFNDVRHFGSFSFIFEKELEQKINKLGTDLLSEDVSKFNLSKNIRISNKNICEVLMDQSIFAGVGNYIKNEALYRSKICPDRNISTLSDFELDELINNVSFIMKDSYASGGCSIRDYYHIDGKTGSYQDKLQVYGKKLDPLGNKVIKEKTPDGRSTYWVPEIQK